MTEVCCKCNLPKTAPKSNSGSATFRYICRLCLMRAEDTEPIFIHPGDSTLANKIYACTGVQIDEKAVVGPTSICMACKTMIYKSYQFLELCQRNDKIIQNLLATHEKSIAEKESTGSELRLVIRPQAAAINSKPKTPRKRVNSNRKSIRSNLEISTTESDISWSDVDEKDELTNDSDEIPTHAVAYETDTQEDMPKKRKLDDRENRVPSLVIPISRLNGVFASSPSSESSRMSRASTIDPVREDDIFRCEFCEGSFPYRIQIKQHIDLYHADRKDELACKFCSKTYLTIQGVRNHTESAHNNAMKYECKLCQRFFASSQSLSQHFLSLTHRAASGEAVYPQRRRSYQGYGTPSRRTSINSIGQLDQTIAINRPRRRPSRSNNLFEDNYNPYDTVCYSDVVTHKCDYCEARFDDRQSLAKHIEVRPCQVELEPLDLDLLLERMDLDELLMPLNNAPDIAIIEPPIEIVDLT